MIMKWFLLFIVMITLREIYGNYKGKLHPWLIKLKKVVSFLIACDFQPKIAITNIFSIEEILFIKFVLSQIDLNFSSDNLLSWLFVESYNNLSYFFFIWRDKFHILELILSSFCAFTSSKCNTCIIYSLMNDEVVLYWLSARTKTTYHSLSHVVCSDGNGSFIRFWGGYCWMNSERANSRLSTFDGDNIQFSSKATDHIEAYWSTYPVSCHCWSMKDTNSYKLFG